MLLAVSGIHLASIKNHAIFLVLRAGETTDPAQKSSNHPCTHTTAVAEVVFMAVSLGAAKSKFDLTHRVVPRLLSAEFDRSSHTLTRPESSTPRSMTAPHF